MMTYAAAPPTAPARLASRPRAVVIGAGFGGLAAAIRLASRGYRVSLVDRLDQPGGRASVFRHDGFTFDAGPTIVTAPFLFEELWTLCGRRMADDVTLKALDPFYEIRFADGHIYRCRADEQAQREEVARLSPGDVAGYDRFMAEAATIYRFGFEEMSDKPFGGLADMLRALPQLVKLRADRSVYAHVAHHMRDERLRMALSFHPLFVGGNPFRVTSIYSLICHLERRFGVHYAMGGTGALVRGLTGLAEGCGVDIQLSTEVDEITVKDGTACGVTLTNGAALPADIVVSNADAAWTYSKLLRNVPRRRWADAKLARARYSMSLFVWYFGTKRRYESVGHHTILMGPRYKELLRDIFDRKVLAEDFSLYLHRPSANDASVAPPGCDAFYVLSPVPHLDAGIDWREAAEPYRQRIAAFLEKTMLPGLSDAIVTSRVMTPQDFRDRLLSQKGAAFGLEPVLFQSAWFRPHNASEDVRNLFLVGAGTHPGAGLPGVLSSARILDSVVPHASAFA